MDWKIQLTGIIVIFIASYLFGNIVFLIIGVLLVMVFPNIMEFMFSKMQVKGEDLSVRYFKYLKNAWKNDYGMNEELLVDNSIIREFEYRGEKYYGFNIKRKDAQTRIVFIVGTSPTRIRYKNSILINDKTDPYEVFMKQPDYMDEEKISKEKWLTFERDKKKKEEDEKKTDDEKR